MRLSSAALTYRKGISGKLLHEQLPASLLLFPESAVSLRLGSSYENKIELRNFAGWMPRPDRFVFHTDHLVTEQRAGNGAPDCGRHNAEPL